MLAYAFSTIVVAIASIFIGFIIATVIYSKKEMNLLKHIAIKENSVDSLSKEYDKLVDKYNRLVYKYNSLSNSKPNYKKEVMEAVKFAMIQSHPDKGICKNNETFIKFRKLYKDIS